MKQELRQKTIRAYIRAKRMMDQGMTQAQACTNAGISRMTFNKYRNQFGDEIAPNMLEVLPVTNELAKTARAVLEAPTAKETSELERILAENNALLEQLKLRKELANYVH